MKDKIVEYGTLINAVRLKMIKLQNFLDDQESEVFDELQELGASEYPFRDSLEDTISGVLKWQNDISKRFEAEQQSFKWWQQSKKIVEKDKLSSGFFEMYEMDEDVKFVWQYADECIIGIRMDGKYSLIEYKTEHVENDLEKLETILWYEIARDNNVNYKQTK